MAKKVVKVYHIYEVKVEQLRRSLIFVVSYYSYDQAEEHILDKGETGKHYTIEKEYYVP